VRQMLTFSQLEKTQLRLCDPSALRHLRILIWHVRVCKTHILGLGPFLAHHLAVPSSYGCMLFHYWVVCDLERCQYGAFGMNESEIEQNMKGALFLGEQ